MIGAEKWIYTYVYNYVENEGKEMEELRVKTKLKNIKNFVFFRGELMGLGVEERITGGVYNRKKELRSYLLRLSYVY